MPRNIEIKAKLADLRLQASLAESLCGGISEVIEQEDVFFHCDNGRLKLRIFADRSGQLIFYRRADQTGPATSSYILSDTSDPESLQAALTEAYGIKAVVRKTRHLYLFGRTRIHLDTVEGLGEFLELEVVLQDGEDESVGRREAHQLMDKLQIETDMLIESAYVDLLT